MHRCSRGEGGPGSEPKTRKAEGGVRGAGEARGGKEGGGRYLEDGVTGGGQLVQASLNVRQRRPVLAKQRQIEKEQVSLEDREADSL